MTRKQWNKMQKKASKLSKQPDGIWLGYKYIIYRLKQINNIMSTNPS